MLNANEEVEGRRSAEKFAEEQKKTSKEKEELLRREATAKGRVSKSAGLTRKRKRVQAQAALEVEAEQRRAQDTRVTSLEEEIARLSLVRDKEEEESDSLASVMFEGGEEGLIMAQQADQPGMLLQERLGLQKMQYGHE